MSVIIGSGFIPPRLCLIEELSDEDTEWLNRQLKLCDVVDYTYANKLPLPPPPPNGYHLPGGPW